MESTLMEYHGPFGGTRTHHGHKLDIIKSALQKYTRRNEPVKAIRCALEMDIFHTLGSVTKGIRTNMINRLRIISCEEFADSNPNLVIMADEFIGCWMENRDIDPTKGQCALIHLIRAFSQVNKSRMLSFIRGTYKYAQTVPVLAEKYKHLFENMNGTIEYLYQKNGDPRDLVDYMGKFAFHHKMKSHKCFYWAFKILDIDEKAGRRFRRTGCEYAIWEYLLVNSGERKKYTEVYFKWYCNYKTENWMYLLNAILISLHETEPAEIVFKKVSEKRIPNIMARHLANEFPIDEYCIDKHTSLGRDKHRGSMHFALVSSQVVDESPNVIEEYRDIYMELKRVDIGRKIFPSKKTPSTQVVKVPEIPLDQEVVQVSKEDLEAILKLPHGQLRCGRHKKVVYVGHDFVYKGPYKVSEASYINNIRYTRALGLLEEIIDPRLRGRLPLEKVLQADGGNLYLVFKNIGDNCLLTDDKVVHMDSKLETNVKLYPRGLIKRISDLGPEQNTDKVKISTLQHLYYRYLLDIGDSGCHNILLREDGCGEQIVAGIDLEERRLGDKGDNGFTYLFRKLPSKKEIEIYKPLQSEIIQLNPMYIIAIEDDLVRLGIDPERVKIKIAKYSM